MVKNERRLQGEHDKLMRQWARRPTVEQLPGELVGRTGRRVDADKPIPVKAQIPVSYSYSDMLEVAGEVVAWTNRAVLVRAVIEADREPQLVWVWANAVVRR